MPKHLDQIAPAPAENVEIASMGISAKCFLDLERQPVHAAAHVGHPSRQPDPNPRRDRDHRRSTTSSTRASAAASTPASTMMRPPLLTTISMRPVAAVPLLGPPSGTTTA